MQKVNEFRKRIFVLFTNYTDGLLTDSQVSDEFIAAIADELKKCKYVRPENPAWNNKIFYLADDINKCFGINNAEDSSCKK